MANKKVGPARWLAALLAAFMLATAADAQQQRLTLNFANTDIEAVARAMADFTGRTFIVDPRVKGTVNLNVDQPMTPDEALAALSTALRLQNIALVDAGGVIRVVPEADAKLQGGSVQTGTPAVGRGEQVVTQVFKLNYESAVSIATVLRPLVASRAAHRPHHRGDRHALVRRGRRRAPREHRRERHGGAARPPA